MQSQPLDRFQPLLDPARPDESTELIRAPAVLAFELAQAIFDTSAAPRPRCRRRRSAPCSTAPPPASTRRRARSAVHGRRRGHDHPPRPGVAHREHHVERAGDANLVGRQRILRGARHGRQRPQVDHAVDALRGGVGALVAANVALGELVVDHADRMAAAQQLGRPSSRLRNDCHHPTRVPSLSPVPAGRYPCPR